MQRFGAALSALICLSFGLQALGLDLLPLKGLYPLEAEGSMALRLALLGLGVWLWVGLRPSAADEPAEPGCGP